MYKSAAALEMAVKAAALLSPLNTSRAISSFYFHRFLCRVFAGGNDAFVLKGGQSMLARTIDARATRDIDLLATRGDLDEALRSLIELTQANWMTSSLSSSPDRGPPRPKTNTAAASP